MAIKVGINGFGRIGRNVLRTALTDSNLDFVAVNDLTSPKTLAHLLKYDSVLGNLTNRISATDDSIIVDGRRSVSSLKRTQPNWTGNPSVRRLSSNPPASSPRPNWQVKHLRGPVEKVIITAPATGEDITIVMGVNEDKYDPRNIM